MAQNLIEMNKQISHIAIHTCSFFFRERVFAEGHISSCDKFEPAARLLVSVEKRFLVKVVLAVVRVVGGSTSFTMVIALAGGTCQHIK